MSNTIRFSLAVAVLFAGIARAPLGAQTAAPMPVADEFNALHFRSIGPAVNSGRLSDIAVYEANPNIFYVGSAHGGVWKTVNNATTFTPLLQDPAHSVEDFVADLVGRFRDDVIKRLRSFS